jgi:phage I-like protein
MFQLTALSSQLTFDITTANADGYIQALPDGFFAAVDGRPRDVKAGKCFMDTIAFAALKTNTPHQAGDLVIDYEHQIINKVTNKPADSMFLRPKCPK